MTLGENLRWLRKSAGLSQEEAAQKLYVSRQSVSKWENDQAEPGVENLKALATLYGVSMDELTGMTPPPGRSFRWTKAGDDIWAALSGLFTDVRSAFSTTKNATGVWAAVMDLFTSEEPSSPGPEAADGREKGAVSFYHTVFWVRTAAAILETLLLNSPKLPLDWAAMLVGLLVREPFIWAIVQVLLWINVALDLRNLLYAPVFGIIGLFLAYLFLCAFFRREVRDYFHTEVKNT